MTIVRVGSNKKYADGWEAAFSKGKKQTSQSVVAAATRTGKTGASPSAKRKKAAAKGKKKK